MSLIDESQKNMLFAQPIQNFEIWCEKQPAKGDHIRVQRMNGIYYHHGIYVSDDEVIHFTGGDDDSVLDWSKAYVQKTNLDTFLKGGILEVKEYTDEEFHDLYPVEAIVSYARACLGDNGYNLIFNNCEHFANACTLGTYRSRQVEKVLNGGVDMGFFGSIWSGIKSIFGGSSSGSRSTSNYNYEPDKVKVAQIEADTKLKLANKELERIELMRDAQLELIKAQAMSQMAINDARARQMPLVAEQLILLQEKMTEVAQKRIELIEVGSLPILREIESFYKEIEDDINRNADEYNSKKLPQLLNMLGEFEEGSPQHSLFMQQISADMTRQLDYTRQQLERLNQRQTAVISSFLDTKEKIVEQTGQITAEVIDKYLEKAIPSDNNLLESDPNRMLLTNCNNGQTTVDDIKQLPTAAKAEK